MPLRDVAAYARRVEAMGYDGLQVAETVHDGLALAMLALEHTERIVVRTSVILAFVRSPMLVAYTAWDLAVMSNGRFHLGLGTQIKQNIEGRFSVPWREPIGRMRDYVDALRSIFATFQTGAPLQFEGEHYRFTRLQPYFNPGPIDVAAPSIWLGGVNPQICRLAGEKADGFITHPTNSNPRYLTEIALPNLRTGSARVGRDPSTLELVVGSPYITGASAAAVDAEREHQRRMMAFLYSTPAYRPTLELFGWADLGERLQRMTREGRWDELSTLVTDEVLDALVPQGTYAELPAIIEQWFGAIATAVLIAPPRDPADDASMATVVHAVRDL